MAVMKRREVSTDGVVWPDVLPEWLRRIYAARGITDPRELDRRLSLLIDPWLMGGIQGVVDILCDAIKTQKHITVAGDYDCDGATGTATAVRGLRLLGAKRVSFIVPDRFKHGYGLSPALVDAMEPTTEVIVTVDSGTSSMEGVVHAKSKGLTVVVTDHHLPAEYLPPVDAIVNPNLKGDPFPSKMLAGVGVMFYVLCAMRKQLREQGWFREALPDLTPLLDLVAIGTVADLVPLDHNNRILVEAGLNNIRHGRTSEGVLALIKSAGKNHRTLTATDIGFSVAPRLNAAGRLENMALGVIALLCEEKERAEALVYELEKINTERREKQASMIEEAERIAAETKADGMGVVVYDPAWHAGLVGLVASRLKESMWRPVFALASAGDDHPDEVRGSGRSIPGFHLRDALAIVDARHPGLMPKFGGHAMAAGLSLKTVDIPRFSQAFDEAAREMLTPDMLEMEILSDGELPAGSINLATGWLLRNAGPWGQLFPEPIFDGVFDVVEYKVIGKDQTHLKLKLADVRDGTIVDAIWFGGYAKGEAPPTRCRVGYTLDVNIYMSRQTPQLMVRLLEEMK